MQEKGTVVENRNNSLLVRIERHSACGDCDRQCGLAVEAEKEEMVVEVTKDDSEEYSCREGQQVILEMEEGNLIFSALFTYIFPLLIMLGGYFLFYSFFGTENMGIVGSLGGLIIGFLIIRFVNLQLKSSRKFEPRIKEILPGNKD